MGQNASLPNFANVTLFKVMQSESLVVPTTVQVASPSGISSGLSPSTLFDTKRDCVGGYIYAIASDAAGPTSIDYQTKISPGETVALSAAGATTTLTLTDASGTVRTYTFASTAVAMVLGYYS
jgi:hypothetical protein